MVQNTVKEIVVIEDNFGDFILFEDYLIEKFDKSNIRHFTNFTNAANYLKESNIVSVVLLDLHLPDLSGMDLVNSVLLLCKNIPVIILTGYVDISLARNCLSIGAADYLIKDETNPELFQKAILYSLDRQSFNKSIEKEKQNYEMLFNFSPQPMFLYDNQTRKILDVNNSAIINYGYEKEEFMQLKIENIEDSVNSFNSNNQDEESMPLNKDFFSERATHRLKNGQVISVETYKNEVEYNHQLAN
jgi:FixJ family two-component response regulator